SWLTLSSGGVLSASTVPATAINSPISLQVKDAANVSKSVPLTVSVPIKVTTVSLPAAEQTGTYSATLAAEGGSGIYTTWSIPTGSLPTGLGIANTGAITGSIGTSALSESFTAQVTDSVGGTGSQQYTIDITPQVAITAPSAQALMAPIGSQYSLALQTTAGTGVGPFTWSVSAGTFPTWLSLSQAGVISVTG